MSSAANLVLFILFAEIWHRGSTFCGLYDSTSLFSVRLRRPPAMAFDKKTRKQVTEQLNQTIFQETVKQLVRQEIEKFEARRSDQSPRLDGTDAP